MLFTYEINGNSVTKKSNNIIYIRNVLILGKEFISNVSKEINSVAQNNFYNRYKKPQSTIELIWFSDAKDYFSTLSTPNQDEGYFN